jgi:hypothetical protein
MAIDEVYKMAQLTPEDLNTLQKVLSSIHEQAMGVEFTDSTPTQVPLGKIVVKDDGAGDTGIYTLSGKNNIVSVGAGAVPTGGIIMWSGTIAAASALVGWALCDGTSGTPDLRNRFIVCADADDGGVAKSTITGSALQTHDGQNIAHKHRSCGEDPGISNTYGNDGSNTHRGLGGGDNNNSLWYTETIGGTYAVARYYALAYIMKT